MFSDWIVSMAQENYILVLISSSKLISIPVALTFSSDVPDQVVTTTILLT